MKNCIFHLRLASRKAGFRLRGGGGEGGGGVDGANSSGDGLPTLNPHSSDFGYIYAPVFPFLAPAPHAILTFRTGAPGVGRCMCRAQATSVSKLQ